MKRWMILLSALLLLFALCATGMAEIENPTVTGPVVEVGMSTPALGKPLRITVRFDSDIWYRAVCRIVRLSEGTSTTVTNEVEYSDDGTEFVVSGPEMDAGEYQATVWVLHEDEEPEDRDPERELSFTIEEGWRPDAPSVSVTPSECLAYQDYEVSVTGDYSDGAELIIESRTDSGEWYSWVEGSIEYGGYAVTTNSIILEQDYPATEVYDFRVAVLENGVWSAWSPTVEMTLTQLGELPVPQLSAPETVPYGQDLVVTVAGGIPDRSSAWLYRIDPGSGDLILINSDYILGEDTVTFGTADLLPGDRARAIIEAKKLGYLANESSVDFTVVEGELQPGPVITPDNAPFQAKDIAVFVLTLDGMDRAEYELDYPDGHTQRMTFLDEDGRISFWIDDPGEYTLHARAHANGGWTDWSDYTFAVDDQPRLDTPEITLKLTELEPGQNLPLFIGEVDNAEQYVVQIDRIDGSYNLDYPHSEHFYEAGSVVMNGYFFLAPGVYSVSCTAICLDPQTYLNSHPSQAEVTVSGEMPQTAPALTFDSPTARVGHELGFTLADARAEQIIIQTWYMDQHFTTEHSVLMEDGRGSLVLWDAGECQFLYSACIDGRWTDWNEPFMLTVEEAGALAAPWIGELPETLPAGRDFSVEVGLAEEADNIRIELFYLSDGEWHYLDYHTCRCSPGSSGEVTFEGYDVCRAGSYRLSAFARDGSGNPNGERAEAFFTVETDSTPAPQVRVDHDVDGINCQFVFTLSETDSSEIEYVVYDEFGNTCMRGTYLYGTDTISVSIGYLGDYTVSVSCLQEDTWSCWSEPISIHVIDLPRLPAPQITLSSDSVPVGTDVDFLFAWQENVKYIHTYVRQLDVEDGLILGGGLGMEDSDTTWTLDGYYLLEPGTYSYGAYYDPEPGCGFAGSEATEGLLTVTAAELAAPPHVELVSDRILENQYLEFNASGEGFDEIRYEIRYQDDGETWTMHQGFSDIGKTVRLYMYSANSSYVLRVMGHLGDRWSDWGEIPFQVSEWPKIDPPELDVPATVQAGVDLIGLFRITEGVSAYDLFLTYADDEDFNLYAAYYDDDDSDWTGVGAAIGKIPGYLLEGGEAYRVQVTAYPEDSMHYMYNTSEAPFTVVGGRPEAPTLRPGDSMGVIGEKVDFEVDEEYDQVVIRYSAGDGGYRQYNTFDRGENVLVEIDEEGFWSFSASVLREGVWSAWSDPISLEFVSYGYLDDPNMTLGATIQGLPLSVTVRCDPKTELIKYTLYMYDDEESGGLVAEGTARVTDGAASFTIEGSALETIGFYDVDIQATALGYYSGWDWDCFRLGGVLRLPEHLNDIRGEAFAGIDAQAVVIPDGCASIGYHAFWDCENLTNVVIPASVTSIDAEAFDPQSYLKIKTPAGSAAEAYANSRGFEVVH